MGAVFRYFGITECGFFTEYRIPKFFKSTDIQKVISSVRYSEFFKGFLFPFYSKKIGKNFFLVFFFLVIVKSRPKFVKKSTENKIQNTEYRIPKFFEKYRNTEYRKLGEKIPQEFCRPCSPLENLPEIFRELYCLLICTES